MGLQCCSSQWGAIQCHKLYSSSSRESTTIWNSVHCLGTNTPLLVPCSPHWMWCLHMSPWPSLYEPLSAPCFCSSIMFCGSLYTWRPYPGSDPAHSALSQSPLWVVRPSTPENPALGQVWSTSTTSAMFHGLHTRAHWSGFQFFLFCCFLISILSSHCQILIITLILIVLLLNL